jgi:hypothetical protein
VVAGPADLRALLADDPAFLRAVGAKLLTFALGRAPSPEDDLWLFGLVERLRGEARPILLSDLVLGVARERVFSGRGAGG